MVHRIFNLVRLLDQAEMEGRATQQGILSVDVYSGANFYVDSENVW